MERIEDTGSARPWNEWQWEAENAGGGCAAHTTDCDYRQGKIARSVRHNHTVVGADWSVIEDYEYRGALGQSNRRTTRLYWPDISNWGSSFETDTTYDGLGRVETQGYPRCVSSPDGRQLCNDGNDLAAPAHTVTASYRQGVPSRVESSLGPSADYGYHPNLQRSRTDYSNGVVGEFFQGTKGMQHPQRIRYSSGTSVHYESWNYGYDGAGNIWVIGAECYTYDQANPKGKR